MEDEFLNEMEEALEPASTPEEEAAPTPTKPSLLEMIKKRKSFLIVVAVLLIAGGLVGYYIMEEQKFLDDEIARLVVDDQDRMERKVIRAMKDNIDELKEEMNGLVWEEYLSEQTIALAYPRKWHVVDNVSFDPQGRFTRLYAEPVVLQEGGEGTQAQAEIRFEEIDPELERDPALFDTVMAPWLEQLQDIQVENYSTEEGLSFTHYSGEVPEDGFFATPNDIYALLFTDGSGAEHVLIISSFVLNENRADDISLQEIVDSIRLLPGAEQLLLVDNSGESEAMEEDVTETEE